MNDQKQEPVARFENVGLSFGDKTVLDGINLEICPGERLTVMGRSGSGKSTLLRLMMGILSPTSGRVFFKGKELSKMRRKEINHMRPRIGMVYQYSALISSLTVAENLALPLEELTDKSREEIQQLVEEKLDLVGVLESRDRMPAELSGGMKKRVGLARGIILDPELILYDEPTAGLDPVISSVIDNLIIELSERIQAASVIVTHEMDSAFRVATRMAMLYEGKIHAQGTPEQIRNNEDPAVAQFISGSIDGPLLEETK